MAARLVGIVSLFLLPACTKDDDVVDTADTDGEAVLLAPVAAQETPAGGALTVTVSLTALDPDAVSVTASSDDQDVLADADIAISGSGTTRTLTLDTADRGLATVTVTGTDGASTATTTFTVDAYTDRSGWVGVVQWSEGPSESAQDIAVGPFGDLWAAGFVNPDGRFQSYVARFGVDGAAGWSAYHDVVLDSQGRGVAVFDDGTSLAAIQAKTVPTDNTQFLVLGEFTAEGGIPTEFDWYDAWDGAAANHTVPGDLAALPDGRVAVSMWAQAATAQVVAVRRLTAAGDEDFTTPLLSATGEMRAAGIAMDDTRTVAGLTTQLDYGTEVNAGGWDGFVVSLDANGDEAWNAQIGTTGDDWVGGMALDATGSTFVCGHSTAAIGATYTNAGGYDVFVAKYDATGARVWLTELGSASDDSCQDVAIGRGGVIYVAGVWDGDGSASAGFVAALDASGAVTWNTAIDTSVASQVVITSVVHEGRDVLVGGHTTGAFAGNTASGDGQDSFIARLSEAGALR